MTVKRGNTTRYICNSASHRTLLLLALMFQKATSASSCANFTRPAVPVVADLRARNSAVSGLGGQVAAFTERTQTTEAHDVNVDLESMSRAVRSSTARLSTRSPNCVEKALTSVVISKLESAQPYGQAL